MRQINTMTKVEDFSAGRKTRLDELWRLYRESGGFVAKKVGEGVEILRAMQTADTRFLSFPADIIATGCRGVVKELCRRRLFDIVVTTCGTLDHDFARCFADYHHGSFDADDRELRKKKVHRLGNIFIPEKSYGKTIEKNLQPILEDICRSRKELSTYEFCWEVGKRIKSRKESSILYWCWKNRIPVIVPGIADGAFGFQMTMFMQDHDFRVDIFRDQQFLLDRMFEKKKTGALIIGGGISKHHVLWWNQFKGGLDYAVYVTTAVEYDGSLSGARTREAISWGKLKEKSRHVTIEGDATVILPLLVGPLL